MMKKKIRKGSEEGDAAIDLETMFEESMPRVESLEGLIDNLEIALLKQSQNMVEFEKAAAEQTRIDKEVLIKVTKEMSNQDKELFYAADHIQYALKMKADAITKLRKDISSCIFRIRQVSIQTLLPSIPCKQTTKSRL